MKTITTRRVIRGARGPARKRLVLTPPGNKTALLSGTALATGILAGLAAFVAMPRTAQAACTPASPTFTITCSGATGVYTDTTTGAGNVDAEIQAGTSWNATNNSGSSGYFNVNAGSNAANNIDLDIFGTTTLTNTGTGLGIHLLSGLNGTVDVMVSNNVGVTSGNDALRLRSGAAGGTGTDALTGAGAVIVNSSGALSATGTGQAIDAKAGTGGVDINLLAGSASSTNSEAISVEAGGNGTAGWGNVYVDVSSGVTVTGGGGEGAIFAFITSANSTGSVFVTNNGEVNGAGATGNGVDARAMGGSVSVQNWGHIGSSLQAGVSMTAGGAAIFGNHSYLSVLGTSGLEIGPAGQAIVDNSAGLTAGLTVDGIRITDISGVAGEDGEDLTPDDWAVDVFNGSDADGNGGVIAGFQNGLYVFNVFGDSTISEGDNGDASGIRILNNGRFEANGDGWDRLAGGLIFGRTLDGVFVSEGSGDLLIDNRLTRLGSIDLEGLDPLVYNSESEDGLLFGQLPGFSANGFTTGIYGNQDGIDFSYIAGDAVILNADGQITGADGSGIRFNNVRGTVYIDNSGTDGLFLPIVTEGGLGELAGPEIGGGRIWGAVNGIDGSNVGEFNEGGGIFINNSARGIVFGVDNGILLSESETIVALNLGGVIEGYYDDGINISESKMGLILNGGWEDGAGNWHEGRIIGADSAIDASSAKVGVFNLPGGLIIGDGDDLDGQAVMQFATSDGFLSGDGGAIVLNAGIMGSQNNPHIDRTWYFPETNEIPEYEINTAQIIEDVGDIELFAMSGGFLGSVSNLGEFGELTIADYRETAADGLISSEGGALTLVNIGAIGESFLGGLGGSFLGEGDISAWEERNEGIMFGRIVATGTTFDCFDLNCEGEGDEIEGNTVINLGSWFTTNQAGGLGPYGGNILASDGADEIINLGFIQTAFGEGDGEGGNGDYTSFVVDDFYNGSISGLVDDSEGAGLLGILSGSGWLSMVDGDADDDTYIFGNFHGSTSDSFKSYLAVDADLRTGGFSDVLWIGAEGEGGGDLFGSTGIVINDLSPSSGDVIIGERILVVSASGIDTNWNSIDGGNTCFDEWCRAGDTFFISDLNPNYVEVSGIGFVRDGMYMWGLKEDPILEIPDPEFYFVADWGPDAYLQPTLTTAAQTAWYETGGVVEDHVYGNVFPQQGAGGSGADLIYDPAPMIPAPAPAKAHSSALWGRLTGSWANRNTEVVVNEGEPGELVFDTGYDQDTYSLQGGLEFRPGGGDDFRLGIFGGYIGSHVSYDDYGASATLKGPTLGGYAALINGGFYVDAEVKGDFLSVEYTTPSTEVSTKATSVGVLANAGYRMEGNGGFIEPIVSLAYVNTRLDDASGGGADISYSNGTSFRGGVGARVGTTVVNANGTSTEFDLLGKIWNEFGSANTVTIDDGVNPPETFTDGITGVFGEVVGRATVYSADRRTSGFVSAGAKFGTDWTTLQAKAGVRQGF